MVIFLTVFLAVCYCGQIFPFNLVTGLTSPLRLLSPPEITLFEVVGTGKG